MEWPRGGLLYRHLCENHHCVIFECMNTIHIYIIIHARTYIQLICTVGILIGLSLIVSLSILLLRLKVIKQFNDAWLKQISIALNHFGMKTCMQALLCMCESKYLRKLITHFIWAHSWLNSTEWYSLYIVLKNIIK